MKKIFMILFAAMLCLTPGAVRAAEEPQIVLLSDAESLQGWNGYGFYNVSLDDSHVKQGQSSVRVDTVHGQTVFLLQFDVPKDVSALQGELFLEMWVYVVTAVEHSKSYLAQIELSSEFSNDLNSYFWNMVGYPYREGWNHLSLKLEDAGLYGIPDLSSLKSLRYTVTVPVETSIFVDEIRITNQPRQVEEDEFGVIEVQSPFIKQEVQLPQQSFWSVAATVLLVLAALSAAVFAALWAKRLIMQKRRGKDEIR